MQALLISGINLGANGINRIIGKATHITGDTLIDRAVIKSGMIDKLKTSNFESGSVTTMVLASNSVTADKNCRGSSVFNKLVANEAIYDSCLLRMLLSIVYKVLGLMLVK